MEQRRVVVTGATSFLGSAVIEGLLKNNYKVYSVVRKNSGNIDNIIKHPDNIIVYKDLNNISEICSVVKKADIFLHFGWDGSGSRLRADKDIQKMNITVSMKALETAKILNCSRFVFSGSQAEYGINHNIIREDSICNPVSEYGKAKLEFGKLAERFCLENSIQFIHLRIFSIYGMNDHSWTLIKSCIRDFEDGNTLQLSDCSQLWNYLYISDFAEAMMRLVNEKIPEQICVLNVAGNDTRPLRDFVKIIYDMTSRKGNYVFGDRPQNAEGIAFLNPDITKIKKLLNWTPQVEFEEGVRTMVGMYRERGQNG